MNPSNRRRLMEAISHDVASQNGTWWPVPPTRVQFFKITIQCPACGYRNELARKCLSGEHVSLFCVGCEALLRSEVQ
jgi:hypothetical protein